MQIAPKWEKLFRGRKRTTKAACAMRPSRQHGLITDASKFVTTNNLIRRLETRKHEEEEGGKLMAGAKIAARGPVEFPS